MYKPMNADTLALVQIAQTVIKYRFPNQYKIGSLKDEQIVNVVNECRPLLNGVTEGDRLQAIIELMKRIK